MCLATSCLQADYQLKMLDKNGLEENICVKSHSFSNNLESLARQKSFLPDVYSEEETLTNKVFLNKSVYRRIYTIPTTSTSRVIINTGISLSHIDEIVSIEDLVIKRHTSGSNSVISQFVTNYSQLWKDESTQNLFHYYQSGNGHEGIRVIIEYTKLEDLQQASLNNTFQSYIHYLPSDSVDNEIKTKNLENIGIIINKECF